MYNVVKIRKISDNQKVINKFVSSQEINWPREAVLAKRLIFKYGIEFLLWVPLPDNKKINTLLWLSCEGGYKYLDSFLLDFKKTKIDLTNQNQKIVLNETKIGEDAVFNKIQSFQDFIKIYVKK